MPSRVSRGCGGRIFVAIFAGSLFVQGCCSCARGTGEVVLAPRQFSEQAGLSAYLLEVGVPLKHEPEGQLRISSDPRVRGAVLRYLEMLRITEEVIAANIANAQTTADVNFKNNPYRRRFVRWKADHAFEVVCDDSPFPRRYEPGHPMADASGFVLWPNVDVVYEKVLLGCAMAERSAIVRILSILDPELAYLACDRPANECDTEGDGGKASPR